MTPVTRATELVWRAAGCPAPVEGDGTPIPPRAGSRAGLAPTCAMCGGPGPQWIYDDAYSDNFRPVDAFDRLFPHVTTGYDLSLCAACVWAGKTLRLRCAPWFARVPDDRSGGGVWFVSRRNLLAALLNPPEPPFVACAPLYGADHGGEANGWRTAFPGALPLPEGTEILNRLQAKHVLAYARIAYRRDRFPLQWDDSVSVTVDVALWRSLAERLGAIAAELRAASLGVDDTRGAMLRLRCPARAPATVHARWPALVRGLEAHRTAVWWPLITDLVPLPEAAPKPVVVRAAPPSPPPQPPQPTRQTRPTIDTPPAVERHAEPTPAPPPGRQLTLF